MEENCTTLFSAHIGNYSTLRILSGERFRPSTDSRGGGGGGGGGTVSGWNRGRWGVPIRIRQEFSSFYVGPATALHTYSPGFRV